MTAPASSTTFATGSLAPQKSDWPRSMNSGDRSMDIHPDFKKLLELFNAHSVDFIANKKAIGRAKDAADIEALGQQ